VKFREFQWKPFGSSSLFLPYLERQEWPGCVVRIVPSSFGADATHQADWETGVRWRWWWVEPGVCGNLP
jgi:hypothetical protein